MEGSWTFYYNFLHMITFYMMLLICMWRSKWSNTSFSLQLCLIIVSYSPIRKKPNKTSRMHLYYHDINLILIEKRKNVIMNKKKLYIYIYIDVPFFFVKTWFKKCVHDLQWIYNVNFIITMCTIPIKQFKNNGKYYWCKKN